MVPQGSLLLYPMFEVRKLRLKDTETLAQVKVEPRFDPKATWGGGGFRLFLQAAAAAAPGNGFSGQAGRTLCPPLGWAMARADPSTGFPEGGPQH